MFTTGAMITGHAGETSFDPHNLTGQLFMKGRRENTFLQLIDGMNAISGAKCSRGVPRSPRISYSCRPAQ